MSDHDDNEEWSAEMRAVANHLKYHEDWHLRACQATNAASNQFHAISHYASRLAGDVEWDDVAVEDQPYGTMPKREDFADVMAAYAASGEGHLKVAAMYLKLAELKE